MIVLDTNVISETMRPQPSAKAVAWLDAQAPGELYLSAPVLAELHYGIARLEDSKRKSDLFDRCQAMVTHVFSGRILAFDVPAAEAYGHMVAGRERLGKPISVMDAMIAAITKSNHAVLATRNTADFTEIGVRLVNPFEA